MNVRSDTRAAAGRTSVFGRGWLLSALVICAALFVAASAGAATKAGAPVNGCPPSIEGTLVVGKTVTAGNGCWQNSPTSYTYKWFRCTDQTAKSCSMIASTRTYTLTTADVGHSLVEFV